jgi:hypothetical protein
MSFGKTEMEDWTTLAMFLFWQNGWPFGQPLLNLEIHLLSLIGHFPAAMWQPMTGPRGAFKTNSNMPRVNL